MLLVKNISRLNFLSDVFHFILIINNIIGTDLKIPTVKIFNNIFDFYVQLIGKATINGLLIISGTTFLHNNIVYV